MPLPFIIIPIAGAMGLGGVGLAGKGIFDLSHTEKIAFEATSRNNENVHKLEVIHEACQYIFEKLARQLHE